MGAAAPLGLRRAVGLADYTTWRVGGEAQWFAEPESREQLQALLHWARGEHLPWGVIGAGSNLLISDQGLPGSPSATGGCRGWSWMPPAA